MENKSCPQPTAGGGLPGGPRGNGADAAVAASGLSEECSALWQDAHELFHVITSSLEDERDRQPRVAHLFDVHSLEVNH